MRRLHELRAIMETRGLLITWAGIAVGLSLALVLKPATAHWLALEDQLLQSIAVGLYLATFVLLVQLNRYTARPVWVPAVLVALLFLRELDFHRKFYWLGMVHTNVAEYEPILKPGLSDAAASVLVILSVVPFLAYAAWCWGGPFVRAVLARDAVALAVASALLCIVAARPVDDAIVWSGSFGVALMERDLNVANYLEEIFELAVPWFFCQAALLALLRAFPAVDRRKPQEAVGRRTAT